jgi:hypothetical protein
MQTNSSPKEDDMVGRIDFRKIETPAQFQVLCERLLSRMFPDFHGVNQAGGDAGIDGFCIWGEQFFQFTHPQSNVPLRKVREDLEKAKQFVGLKKWYFLCSQSLSKATWTYIEAERVQCPFQIIIWDAAVLRELLSKQPDIVDEFLTDYAKKAHEGTEAIRGDLKSLKKIVTRAKRRPPRSGDAPEGLEIDENQRQDIHDLIMDIAEYQAKRRHLKNLGPVIGHEWKLFKDKYDLSSYDRLPKAKFAEAIGHLKTKWGAQRNNEPRYMTSQRERNGIHAIAKSLGWDDAKRHEFYRTVTGKNSLNEMSRKEIHKVFAALRQLQADSDAA